MSISNIITVIISLAFIYCIYDIYNLKLDLQISETNNIKLEQAINNQKTLINDLQTSINQIQTINKNLNDNLEIKTQALSKLEDNFKKLREQYQKDPIKANNVLNTKIKMYNQCITDITSNNLKSESCQDFY